MNPDSATYDDPSPIYDEGYAYGIADHASDGPAIDPEGNFAPVRTTYGYDHGFSGDDLTEVGNDEPSNHIGEAHINNQIDARVQEASGWGRSRITMTAEKALYGNYTFPNLNPQPYLIRARSTRRSLTITNQGTLMVFVGSSPAISRPGTPDCVLLPVASGRTLFLKGDVYVFGTAGAIFDFVEEIYNG